MNSLIKDFPKLLLAVSLSGWVLIPSAHAEFATSYYNGDYLYRTTYSVPNNQTISASTSNCAGSEDTVLFLIEGDLSDGVKTTRAFNDDYGGSWCSSASYKNISGSTKTFIVLATSYNSGYWADVTLVVTVTGNPTIYMSDIRVVGVNQQFTGTGSAETAQVVPVRSTYGGKPMDSVLFIIHPINGGLTRFDDDSGMMNLSKTTNNCPSNQTCWMVAGNYWLDNGGSIGVWSQGTSDSDGDKVSNATENSLIARGELPSGAGSKKDADDDGLSDFVELMGVATASTAGSDQSLCMPWQGPNSGADPKVQDLFVEVDWMNTAGGNHNPYANLATDVNAAFSTDSAWTSRDIRTHIERSQEVGHWRYLSFSNCPGADTVNFYTIKNNVSFFDPLRRTVYHYLIFGHSQKKGDCSVTNSSGVAETWGNDLMVTLTGTGTDDEELGTHNHELGHNLYLDHNGNEFGTDFSCVHSSVMSYRYQFSGWTNAGNRPRSFAYSRGNCLSGTNAGNGCANTCINSCVPNGQVSPKLACPLATSGPNAGRRVSNGTCDCDRDEWAQPSTPTANRVSLAFQGSGYVVTGAPLGEDDSALAEYLHGRLRKDFTEKHKKISERKEEHLKKQGLVEGIHYTKNPDNGKFYAVE